MPEDDLLRYPWYTVVSGNRLEQGDILLGCPVLYVPGDTPLQPGSGRIRIDRQNVVVMTQSCDLAIRDDGTCKADDVILAALYFQRELKDQKLFGEMVNWENARKGRFPRYHVLNKCEIPGQELDYMLVDLERVSTLSVDAVREFAAAEDVRLVDVISLLDSRRDLLTSWVHLDAEANRIVAIALADAILETEPHALEHRN